jgi:hypothetical protein
MSQRDEERTGHGLKDESFESSPETCRPRRQTCNDESGRVVSISAEDQIQDARSIADFVAQMLAMPDEDPPGVWDGGRKTGHDS